MFILIKETLTWSWDSLHSKMWLTVLLFAQSTGLSINDISSTSQRVTDKKTIFPKSSIEKNKIGFPVTKQALR